MMTNKQKQGKQNKGKGDRWERACAQYLGWIKMSRRGYTGPDLVGDGFNAECRDRAGGAGRAGAHLKDAEAQCSEGDIPIAIIKERNKSIGEAVVVLRLKHFKEITQNVVDKN